MPEIEKTYEPASVETKWYDFWLRTNCFTADPARVSEQRPAYSIVIPPPNVTGVLTLGHVLNNTIQDILARRARMFGKEVLWLPGTDHAGIATQNVVEKTLRKSGEMKHRDDLGREALVAKIWEWKEKYGGIIIQQLKKLGASCDWSRERFTMDAEYSRCVSRVFVDLYKKGLIYRDLRMVNWCPSSLTALSDEEVIMKPQNGTLYYFKVQVVEKNGEPVKSADGEVWLTIATTRPETIPGDTAVAVNPKDTRYSHLKDKFVRRPLPVENQAFLPIVEDEHVEFEFGTGVLKVTPAHDKADHEIWQRIIVTGLGLTEDRPELREMKPIIIINPNGTMNKLAGELLVDLDRFAARNVAVEKLRELGVLEKEEPYQNNVGYSERADVPIEHYLSEQWFLEYPKVRESIDAVADGAMKFFPERWTKVYDHWMTSIRDWCISRQIWWGHRIPIWTRSIHHSRLSDLGLPNLQKILEERITKSHLNPGQYIPVHSGTDAEIDLYFHCHWESEEIWRIEAPALDFLTIRLLESLQFKQDPDVLDTWFSSWLWPFATMGWPEKTDTLAKFYPTTDLVTGPDIIFFWVARMIMAGFEWMGEMPFRNVYFTGIIRDKQGRKMSKSLGNSPDPLDLIAKYGADALRFGVMRSAPLGSDILFDEKNVELGRNFCTKLWNAARFRQMQGGDGVAFPIEGEINAALLTSDDKWILLRLDAAIREISTALEEYRFSDAANALYRFFWSEYCDWYVEATKAAFYGEDAALKTNTLAVIDFVLAHTLRLMHPFLPFITEELWHGLGFNGDLPEKQGGETIMFAHWPKPLGDDFKTHYALDETDEKLAMAKYETVTLGRNLRSEVNIPSSKKVKFVLKANAQPSPHDAEVLKILLNASEIEITTATWIAPKGTPTTITPLGELFLPLEGLIDIAAERARLEKEIAKVEGELVKVEAKLGNVTFVSGAPANVIEEFRKRKSDWHAKRERLQKMLAVLGA